MSEEKKERKERKHEERKEVVDDLLAVARMLGRRAAPRSDEPADSRVDDRDTAIALAVAQRESDNAWRSFDRRGEIYDAYVAWERIQQAREANASMEEHYPDRSRPVDQGRTSEESLLIPVVRNPRASEPATRFMEAGDADVRGIDAEDYKQAASDLHWAHERNQYARNTNTEFIRRADELDREYAEWQAAQSRRTGRDAANWHSNPELPTGPYYYGTRPEPDVESTWDEYYTARPERRGTPPPEDNDADDSIYD